MIGETDTGLALLYEVEPDGLSNYRMKAIDIAISGTIQAHLDLSDLVAVSGAMRWPHGMRPEVLINTEVRML